MKTHVHSHQSGRVGIYFALTAALLFGASTPFSKVLLGSNDPIVLAALLYLGSGIGLTLWWWARRSRTNGSSQEAGLKRADFPWLAGAILSGGVVGPILLLFGLRITTASSASLLLNLEGVFTALLAWFVFRENFDHRIALGMALIVVGAAVLSWPGRGPLGDMLLALALIAGAALPSLSIALAAGLLGLLSYGLSLVLFVVALRELGTARTGAYFSIAPFAGALFAIMFLGELITIPLVVAGVLMALGVSLHLTERHEHLHTHDP